MCEPLAQNWNNIVTGDNLNSLLPSTFNTALGTVANISCYIPEKYELQGSSQVTCVQGKWVPDPPVCVRKDRLPDTDNIDEVVRDLRKQNDSDYYSIVLIIIACACALILLVIVVTLIYKFYCVNRRHIRGRRLSESTYKTDDHFEEMREREPWPLRDSPSRTSQVYSSRLSVHSYPTAGVVGRHHSVRSAPVVGGLGSRPELASPTRTWDMLSVDRLLRDIEYSRRHNPRHSWRDFATVSRTPSMLTQY